MLLLLIVGATYFLVFAATSCWRRPGSGDAAAGSWLLSAQVLVASKVLAAMRGAIHLIESSRPPGTDCTLLVGEVIRLLVASLHSFTDTLVHRGVERLRARTLRRALASAHCVTGPSSPAAAGRAGMRNSAKSGKQVDWEGSVDMYSRSMRVVAPFGYLL